MIITILQWVARIAIALLIIGVALGVAVFFGMVFAMCAADKKDRKDGQLPWHCVLTDEACGYPEKDCNDCAVFQKFKHEEETEHGLEDYDD